MEKKQFASSVKINWKADRHTHIPLPNDELISEVIYRNEIPPFAAATLERLYSSVYCTLARVEAYESLDNVHTYVRKSASTITAIILFREEGRTISVINQQIRLSAEQISRFCEKVFQTFWAAQTIRFYALDTSLDVFSFPYQQIGVLEENIILLPPDKDAYLASFKGQFRKQLLQSADKVKKDHPSYELKFFARSNIPMDVVEAIFALARKRMVSKGKAAYTDGTNIVALEKTLKKYGHVAIAVVNGQVCGGSIWFSVGKRHFHYVAAHDPDYDQYMLGKQIWLAAILHSLDLHGEECWLMGGANEHKARFGATTHTFNSITIYRSRFHMVLNCRTFGRHWLKQKTGALGETVKTVAKEKSLVGRSTAKLISITRTLRSHARGG